MANGGWQWLMTVISMIHSAISHQPSAMFTDLRHAVRRFLNASGFTLLVVAVLALGLGATTSISSLGVLPHTRVLASLLFGVGASDPLTFAVVCVVLPFVVASAAWLPGRRATRVDPLVALRAD